MEKLRAASFDLVLSDIQMARISGMELLEQVQKVARDIPVVLITADAEPGAAMDAISRGAADYLAKPVDIIALRTTVARALERRRLTGENQRLRSEAAGKKTLIGTSPAMLELYKQIAQIAPTNVTVLIVGESGSGKELAGRNLHARSRRAGRPYLAANCPPVRGRIFERKLFGAGRGAFT